jgi:phosphoglycolate phosphatase-like HAD superfamily hydrolase
VTADTPAQRVGLHPALDAIEVVIFDKDGTLLDFGAMWSGWATALGHRLEAATGRPVSGDVFATIGYDPAADRVRPGSPLAVATMSELADVVAAVVRRWCPSVAAARRAVETAWFQPDPVSTAVPTADLSLLFRRLVGSGLRLSVATTDDRGPTEASLDALGLRSLVSVLACGDDGHSVKPDPAAVFAICRALRVDPGRCAVVGDTPADLAMGRAAGAGRTIGVLSGVGSRDDLAPHADALLDSVGDLLVA